MHADATTERPWWSQYPKGVPRSIDADAYVSLLPLIDESMREHARRPAYAFMGKRHSYADIDELSCTFAAWLQSKGFARGDRVAVMLPNVPQYPIVAIGILRAGLVIVNVNPLYTARELEQQLADADTRCVITLANFAATLSAVLPRLAQPQQVVLTSVGDLLDWPKRAIVNFVVQRVKKMVPPYTLPAFTWLRDALAAGSRLTYQAPALSGDDVALLQYTGGTTGVAKGAVLLHRNLVANVLQSQAWHAPALESIPSDETPTVVAALPLYHIFGFTTLILLGLRCGQCNVLIPNPRDLDALFKAIARERIHSFPAVNTLFAAMLRHPRFATVDWRHLRLSVGGGMAVQAVTAQAWMEKTGCAICEGYGLSETSPSAICNSVTTRTFSGNIGVPLPNTEVRLLDDDGRDALPGTPGEIAIRGPQVMAGYWKRPEATAEVMTADGYFRTGDIGTIDAAGSVRLVDRKKDIVIVGGFNVYPTEIEDVVSRHPGVLECAAVGTLNSEGREIVKLVLVRRDPALTEATVRAWCEELLTGYKRPKIIEFRSELPKTNVGKVLRRALRDEAPATATDVEGTKTAAL